MSVEIDVSQLRDEESVLISKELEIEIKNRYQSRYAKKNYLILYSLTENTLKLPFAFAYSLFKTKPNKEKKFEKTISVFKGALYHDQTAVAKEMVSYLNKTGSVFLAAYPGFGKTATVIKIMTCINLPTVILSHRIIISSQWVKSYTKFTGSTRIKILKSKDTWDDDVDIYIINPTIINRLPEFPFDRIGLLVCDEAHSYCTQLCSNSFFKFSPKYCIGLSATPNAKKDGTKVVLDHVFGEKIFKDFWQRHNVYYYNSGFVPEFRLNREGKTDWGSVLESQAIDVDRNNIIIRMCKYFNTRNILVLCKRTMQASFLFEELKKQGEDVDVYMENQKKVNYDCRILISTYSKGGVGFDHPKLNMLIMASDVASVLLQYIGRVFRGGGRNTSEKTNDEDLVKIVDIVDDFEILKKHWRERRRFYKKAGGTVHDFKKKYKDF